MMLGGNDHDPGLGEVNLPDVPNLDLEPPEERDPQAEVPAEVQENGEANLGPAQIRLAQKEGSVQAQIDALDARRVAGNLEEGQAEELQLLQEELNREPVRFRPNPGWWDDLTKSQLDAFGCIYELVDNSVGHQYFSNPNNPDSEVKLNIDILLFESPNDTSMPEKIVLRDNAKGISRDILDRAISMWGMTGSHDDENISEHGCGMKYGMRGLGRNVTVITKTADSPKAIKFTTEDILAMTEGGFRPTYVNLPHEGFELDHGTQITITELTDNGKWLGRKDGYMDRFHNYLLKGLGHRYQILLPTRFSLADGEGLRLHRILANGNAPIIRNVHALGPLYYDRRNGIANQPMIGETTISDDRDEWEVKFTAGRYPETEDEWTKMITANAGFADRRVEAKANDGEPYKRKAENCGFDIVRRGIVLERGFLEAAPFDVPFCIGKDLPTDGIRTWNNDFQYLIGQIIITKGFQSGTQKTKMARDRHFAEMCAKISDILYGQTEFNNPVIGQPNIKEKFLKMHIRGSGTKNRSEAEFEAGLVENWRKDGYTKITGEGSRASAENENLMFPDFKNEDIFRQVWDGPGRVDILINENTGKKEDIVCVEVKKGEAYGLDVYQLLMYMDEHNTKWGILAACGFKDGAVKARTQINQQRRTKKWFWKRKKEPFVPQARDSSPYIHFYDLNVNTPPIPENKLDHFVRRRDKKENPDNLYKMVVRNVPEDDGEDDTEHS